MASKDQAIGGVICLVCVLVAVFYIAALFFYEPIISALPWLNIGAPGVVQFWLIAIPVLVAFVAILAIGAWIGWTMATTPPPKPTGIISAMATWPWPMPSTPSKPGAGPG